MPKRKPPFQKGEERQVPLQDVVLSNSWALQAILQYLEEIHPGARDRIWEHYQAMKEMVDTSKMEEQRQDGNNGSKE
ncbi:MAG: hypothetical protein C4527_02200 [Candidatus Omnitrophota bacterium]|jgi:hypothetical protein|nr:MAG: hypothetical protein C4527_02200 [Candidatus Omnitrophota bacterium]